MSKPDYWTSSAYKSSASFVPLLSTKVLQLLSPQPSESILDLGCGDGQLTSSLASLVGSNGHVLGLDSSASMIATASAAGSGAEYAVHDCGSLKGSQAEGREWDAVFSNAALHWVLRSPDARRGLFKEVAGVLRKGGRLVFEMGGKGNVAEVNAAIVGAMVDVGAVDIERARESVPWFFPSAEWMRKALEDAGLEVKVCELEYRPTKLNPDKQDGSGGLEGWVRLMGAQSLAVVEEGKRDAVVRRVCDVLHNVITREEDGSQWIGYVRLRAVAIKP